jgi:organic radical activating enzyme
MHENEFLYQLKEATEKFKTKNVVLSGGDPLSINNRKFIKKLLSEQSNNYNFCIYTGYIIDEIKLFGIKGFKFIKCGQYVKDDPNLLKPLGKTDEYISFASRNQSLYNDRFELLSKDGTYFFKKEDNHGLTTLAGQYDRQDVESHKEYSNIESKT